MYNTSFIKKILVVAIVVFSYSCDKDFNAIGDDLISDDHFGLESEKYDVLAFNQEVTPIQSNALADNALGIYENPVFGTTTANFVTQVTLANYSPSIGADPVIESVVLKIPYHSHTTETLTEGGFKYELDSIYGPSTGKIKLSIYESGYQMRNSYFDNGSQYAQLYYTDQNALFDSYKVPTVLNDAADVKQNSEFVFDAAQMVDVIVDETTKAETKNYSKPEMRLSLNKDAFKRIIEAPASKLSAADVFQEYFKGLYFKVEKSGSSASNMALMDFSKGTITITYKCKTDSTTDAPETTETRTLGLNLTGSTASLLQEEKSQAFKNAITEGNINRTSGDERLYLKGGQGSLAVLKLFDQTDVSSYDSSNNLVNVPNGVSDQLDEIRHNFKVKNWRINEANMVFYIDADQLTTLGNEEQVKRVYLYNLTNNVVLADYSSDGTSAINSDPKNSRYIFGGMINLDNNKRGKTYKIRITDHLRSLIKDETVKNVDLGLVVTQSIGIVTSNILKEKNTYISQAPRASVMNPLGTILYGGRVSPNVPEDKRLRLEVYYTKPN
ncbi:DUF4270 domain-containing protein [Flavobacterium procerum]|uniref:DUF4270 domain-containing protein n=1 Tax=Flavobacterium procerum TaxID=1455569 RepID=A0ABV6BQD4_9FLAO